MAGWLKIHRQLMHSPVFENEKLFKVFMYCLMKASHKEHKQIVGQKVIVLKSGQFVFGRKRASEELSMSESTVWRYIKMLNDVESITVESNNKFSVVSIVNWGFYQQEDSNVDNKRTTDEQQMNNKRTTDEQQMDTNKNVKNLKNEKNVENEKNNNTPEENGVGVVFQSYEELGFGRLNGYKSEQLNKWIETFNAEMVTKAMQIASNANKANMGYLTGILNNWKEKGFKSINDVEAESKQRNNGGRSKSSGIPNPYQHDDNLPF